MCMLINPHRFLCLGLLLVTLTLLPGAGFAQTDVFVPGELTSGMPTDPELQTEIDKVLGITESKIKAGITDPGVDLVNLAVNKALDEIIKGIADGVVLAPAAEKIMSIYQKTKDKRLVKKLASLRQVWKDGQERLNKLNYQDFKVRYEFAMQHNQETSAIRNSRIKGIESQMTKDIWNTQVSAINQTYDNNGPTSKLIKRYLDKGNDDLGYYNLAIINGTLGSTELISARNKLESANGKPVFLSPYARLRLQQKSLAEARERHADLANYGQKVAATVNFYRMAEAEQATRTMLSKRISDPYMVRFQKK